MPSGAKLPRFTISDARDPQALVDRMNQFITTLETRLVQLEGPIVDPRDTASGHEVFAVTNSVERRAFDPTTVTLQELAEVVGTWFDDLKNEERLR